jgi:hypothetical protein
VAPEGQSGVLSLAQQCEVDAETAVGRLGAGDRLEDQVDGRLPLDRSQRVGDVREHAALGRHPVPLAQLIEKPQELDLALDAVRRRVDADDSVATAQQQPVEYRGGDARRIIRRVVRLDAHG